MSVCYVYQDTWNLFLSTKPLLGANCDDVVQDVASKYQRSWTIC